MCALCAGLFGAAAPASGATGVRGQTLLPGVVYSRQVEFTAHGPVVVHVISAPKPTGLYALKPVLSNDAILGRERVTSMLKRVSGEATVAGINGDLFSWTDGHPSGGLIRGGVLERTPADLRSTIGVDTDGVLHVERVHLAGTWQGSGQRRVLGINEVPRPGRTSIYTPVYGARTPAETGNPAVAILRPFPASKPNTLLTTTVAEYVTGGNQPIPPDGAVIVARGAQAPFLTAEAPAGSNLTVLLTLTPPWTNVLEALGGGPVVVRNGKPVYRSLEDFTTDQLTPRHPRTGVGQTADGRILLVAVDGRQPGYSTGLTNFELALTMMRLGCVTASALDAGGSTTMAFDGRVLNRPSDPGGERAVAEALTLFYYGVYAPALPSRVLSPNADGVDDTQTFSYKLVRPSAVSATLAGPNGASLTLDRPAVLTQPHARIPLGSRRGAKGARHLQARALGAGGRAHRDLERRGCAHAADAKPAGRGCHALVAWPFRPLPLQRHRHERGGLGRADGSLPPARLGSRACRSPASRAHSPR